ncbi:MAG: serine/threonine protein kinase [Mycobacterium sp.]|uniref:serine/threonine-protein kinase n=1 Tax=Mycobacterium sp. TaxID=1785 RepID=UPI000CB44B33|nr:serine/threonine-protein kinase [Mycobacterium sp.]PJE01211.1 MAG: serine/threonine protein kinase [Mycobacterium sp.]PJE13157.1 MAG: serine/threonine protein kinase [Mycobacterium sp.]PJE22039.1 MAG: serine/threonine protein kinase [Mycobacterium sp.]
MDGTPFGRYRLIELLGRGGMGEVWRAYDTAMQRVVALKVLPANFADDPVYQERFRREAHAAAGLDEPHVVPIHDFGEIEGRLFVTMRLITGRDLGAVLAEGPLEPARVIRIIEQIASALHAAHRIGLIHRDVKPSNILLAEDDFAYLIDFGIARAAGETGLTTAGAAIGTWAYMSPERLNSGQADARADIYALACVMHEALTGQPPYPGESLEQQIVGHLTAPPPRPSALQPWVPQTLDAVIAKGMAKEPDQRYATTVELARAARNAMTVELPRPEPTMPAHPSVWPDHPTAGPIPGQDTRLAPTWAAAVRQPPPGPPGSPQAPAGGSTLERRDVRPPAGGRNPRSGGRRTVATGLAAAVVLAASIAITAVIVRGTSASRNSGAQVSTPGPTASVSSNSAPPTSSTPPSTNPTSTNPTVAPMSLTGKWSGPVSGDQTGFDLVANIVDGAQLTGTVSYPQLNCAGIWTGHGSAANGTRLLTETITYGSCVTSEITLAPQNDGTLYFTSTYYAASKQRYVNIYATLRR